MTRVEWLRAILGVVVVAAIGVWLASLYEWVDEKKPRQLSGEARKDPRYATRLLIEQLGYRTRVLNDPAQLMQQVPAKSTIVLLNGIHSIAARQLQPQLVDWVKQGGHLVLASANDHDEAFQSSLGLRILGLHVQERNPTTDYASTPSRMALEGRSLDVDVGYCYVFALTQAPIWTGTVRGYRPRHADVQAKTHELPDKIDKEVIAAARWSLGKGTVTVACNDAALSNYAIEEFDNAEFTARLLIDEQGRTIVFVPHPEYPNLAEWLLEHAWSAVIAATVLLLLALWHAMPRFGPLAPPESASRPGLRQHLMAVANFHLRKHHYLDLLRASREAVTRLAERHFGTANLKFADLAILAGVSEGDLRQALNVQPHDRIAYLRQASVLAAVSDALNAARPLSSKPTRSKKS